MFECYLPLIIGHPPGNETIIVAMKRTHKAPKAVFVEKFINEIRCC